MRRLIIFGNRNFADIAWYYFQNDSPYDVAGFTVDGAFVRESTFHGLPVVPFEELASRFPPAECDVFVAVGILQVNRLREKKTIEAEAKGYRLASFVSSRADVFAGITILPNTFVMERAGIQPFVSLGRNTIVWSHTHIGFHTKIGNHCWLACPLLGESVEIGDRTFIGLGATIAPGVRVANDNIVGAGALITKDTAEGQVFAGISSQPSRVPSHRLWSFGRQA